MSCGKFALSIWFVFLRVDSTIGIVFVSVITATSSDNEISFLVDVSVVRVEVLSEVVVEDSGFSIVLHANLLYHTHLIWWQLLFL